MEPLEGILAFALTLIALSTAVTAIVEVIQRVLRRRPAGLLKLMMHFYDHELQKTLNALKHPEIDQAKEDLIPFLQQMVTLSGTAKFDGNSIESYRHAGQSGITRLRAEMSLWRRTLGNVVDKLSPQQFRERLRWTRLGQAIEDQPDEQEKTKIYKALEQRFDVLGTATSEGFSRNARMYTVTVGLLLALVGNIDSLHLLKSYLSDAELRQSIIEHQEAILERAQSVLAKAASHEQNIGTEGSLPATTESATQAANAEANKIPRELAEVIGSTKEEFQILGTYSFPIGWMLYPNCERSHLDYRCELSGDAYAVFGQWLLGIILTGFLTGLGSPFWFEVVQNLMRIRSGGRTAERVDKDN